MLGWQSFCSAATTTSKGQQGKMEAARRYLTHACMLAPLQHAQSCKMRPPTAIQVHAISPSPFHSNSVTAASLAHMQAHMALVVVNSPKPRDRVGLRWGPCEVPPALALQLLKILLEGWIIVKPLLWRYIIVSPPSLLCGSFV